MPTLTEEQEPSQDPVHGRGPGLCLHLRRHLAPNLRHPFGLLPFRAGACDQVCMKIQFGFNLGGRRGGLGLPDWRGSIAGMRLYVPRMEATRNTSQSMRKQGSSNCYSCIYGFYTKNTQKEPAYPCVWSVWVLADIIHEIPFIFLRGFPFQFKVSPIDHKLKHKLKILFSSK